MEANSPSVAENPQVSDHTYTSQAPVSRGHYTIYTPEQKAEIAKYAVEKGNLKLACDKFSEEYGIKVKESTVRQFKKAYFDELKEGKRPEDITALRGKRRGRPAKMRAEPSSPTSIAPVTRSSSVTTVVIAPPVPNNGHGTVATELPSSLGNPSSVAMLTEPPVPKITSVPAEEEAGREIAVSEYTKRVGDIGISSSITDLMNGNENSAKPLVLVAFCTDGKKEMQELSSRADVAIHSNLCDLSLIADDICKRTVALVVGTQCQVNQDFFSRCPTLKVVVVLGASYNEVDLEYASQVGIIVCNVPDIGIEEIADSTFSLILSLYRQTALLHTALQMENGWKKLDGLHPVAKNTRRIRGKTLGLVGLGKIGIAVAQRAKAFGFKVIFYDPSTSEGLEVAVGGLEKVNDITDVLKRSDCISLHCSLTEESRHIIDESTLRLMKRGAFLVNVADCNLVDEVALVKALRGRKLAGAALDNFTGTFGESSTGESQLLKQVPNLVCTPCTSWYSRESFLELQSAGIQLALQALTSMDGEGLSKNCVNAHQLNVNLCQLRWASIS